MISYTHLNNYLAFSSDLSVTFRSFVEYYIFVYISKLFPVVTLPDRVCKARSKLIILSDYVIYFLQYITLHLYRQKPGQEYKPALYQSITKAFTTGHVCTVVHNKICQLDLYVLWYKIKSVNKPFNSLKQVLKLSLSELRLFLIFCRGPYAK